jgi:hypothetical protein
MIKVEQGRAEAEVEKEELEETSMAGVEVGKEEQQEASTAGVKAARVGMESETS